MTTAANPAETRASYQVVMPKLGLTMTQATLVEWLKADGEWVEKGEPLFVLETEKANLEIEAPSSGTLHILVPAGDTVPVHTPIAELGREDGTLGIGTLGTGPLGTGRLVAGTDYQSTNSQSTNVPIAASPKARGLARRLGVDLAGLAGSGARGMIVAADVAAAASPAAGPVKASPVARRLAAQAGLDLSEVAGSGPGGRIMRQDIEETLAPAAAPAPPAAPLPLTGLRGIIAERLSASWRERPHVTITTEADATNLVSARGQLTAELGHKVAYDALLVALVARALREQPHINVRLTEAGIEQLAQINIGVAVDTERGLLVPVVRDAAGLSLPGIQRTLAELAERALAGRSLPDDLVGGTFTITNLGMFEVDAFTPIINPPESAILGVGRIVAKPVAVERQVVVRDVVTLSLSFDHRLIDGAPAARFLQRVKQLVERPFALVLGADEATRAK